MSVHTYDGLLQSDLQSGVDKQKNQLTLDFIGFSNVTQSNWFNCYFTHALRQKNEQLW